MLTNDCRASLDRTGEDACPYVGFYASTFLR